MLPGNEAPKVVGVFKGDPTEQKFLGFLENLTKGRCFGVPWRSQGLPNESSHKGLRFQVSPKYPTGSIKMKTECQQRK